MHVSQWMVALAGHRDREASSGPGFLFKSPFSLSYLLPHFIRGIVTSCKQSLPRLIGRLEAIFMSIDLSLQRKRESIFWGRVGVGRDGWQKFNTKLLNFKHPVTSEMAKKRERAADLKCCLSTSALETKYENNYLPTKKGLPPAPQATCH